MIVSAGRDRIVHIFDIYAFKRMSSLRGHSASITSAKFFSKGLVTVAWDKEVLIWSIEDVSDLLAWKL